MRFDLELERRAGRRDLEQLLEQERALLAWCPVAVAQPACADPCCCVLMRPAGYRGAEVEQRVVQQHELAVGGQATVRLQAVEWLPECAAERRERRVWAVRAAEAVGEYRRMHCRNCRATGAVACYEPATVL